MSTSPRALVISALLLSFLMTACAGPAPAPAPALAKKTPAETSDKTTTPRDALPRAVGPVATVDGVAITAEAFNAEVAFMRASGSIPEAIRGQRDQLLDTLIERHLIERALRRGEVHVAAAEVEGDLARMRQIHGADTLKAQLDRMGWSEATYRARLTENRALMKLTLDQIGPITPEDIRAYYDTNQHKLAGETRVELQQILVPVAQSADASAKAAASAKIKALHAQATAPGADFAALARATTPKLWSLGLFARGDLIAPIANAAFALKDGEVSAPVQTIAGWHILRRVRTVTPPTPTLEQASAEIRRRLREARLEEAKARALQALRVGVYIKRMPENIR